MVMRGIFSLFCLSAPTGTSPSGAHTEPWTFCVIKSEEIKQEIRAIVEAEEYLNYSQRMSRQWTTDLKPLKTDFVKEYLTDAPFLIIVFKQIHGNESIRHIELSVEIYLGRGMLSREPYFNLIFDTSICSLSFTLCGSNFAHDRTASRWNKATTLLQ